MSLLFGFSGRIGRLQWWLAQLVILVILTLGLGIAYGITVTDDPNRSAAASEGLDGHAASVFLAIAAAVVLMVWINMASTVKRFHDRNKSGYWFLIIFVPYIGSLWQLVECGFLPGTPGGNNYGPSRGGGIGDYDDMVEDYAQPQRSRVETPKENPAPRPAMVSTRRPPSTGFGRRGV